MTEKEKEKRILEKGSEIESRRWFKEMDEVEISLVRGAWKRRFGCYYYKGCRGRKGSTIVVSILREIDGVIETLYHEIAHHIEFRHAKDFVRERGVCHSGNFQTILKRILRSDGNTSLKELVTDLEPYYRKGWVWNKDKTQLLRVNL